MLNDAHGAKQLAESCIECGSSRLAERLREQDFVYGSEGNQTTLTASMPVISCLDCGYEYFDERGEAARHAAVCKHLGVFAPSEIREIREATGLGRLQFCDLAGFGSASLQRWEAGAVVPNASSDRLIFLLQYADNIERLKHRHESQETDLKACDAEAEPIGALALDGILEVRTRSATKRFPRLTHRVRVAYQADQWSLRAHLRR